MGDQMSGSAIRQLDETVVNRIAAGEVVQRPVNGLKEMVENSLDAKSTLIQVTVKQGGLKLLQIQDNGTGIQQQDMNIVCERFTTSKLQKFEDMQSIATFGFRGEALASISHVAHVTITSKTEDSKCSFRGQYVDGKLKERVQPCAGNKGTMIVVEDLFYNMPLRRRALKSPVEEHSKILEMISRYAVHYANVGFTLKKSGDNMAEFRTSQNSTKMNNIRTIYGPAIANELLKVQMNDDNLKLKVEGYVTNANYNIKKKIFLLFINHRLVESVALSKAVESVYSTYLPKGSHPFLYLSLEMAPQNVDVNVHPTKHEVHFLHADTIVIKIQEMIEKELLSNGSSRVFVTQRLVSGQQSLEASAKVDENASSSTKKPQEQVRTDNKMQTLEKLISKASEQESPSDSCFTTTRDIKLLSVIELRDEVQKLACDDVIDIFKNLTFIGCLDSNLALFQYDTKLYLANTIAIAEEFFYQILIKHFANFGIMTLSETASIHELAMLALNCKESKWKMSDGPKEDLAEQIQQMLVSKRLMLEDYFSIVIDENGFLSSIPYLLEDYWPASEGLPMFILQLASNVDWGCEKECFRNICRETAKLFTPEKMWNVNQKKAKESVVNILFPAFYNIAAPRRFLEEGTLLQVTDLPDLYKVFERC